MRSLHKTRLKGFLVALLFTSAISIADSPLPAQDQQPELSSSLSAVSHASGSQFMVVTANAYASDTAKQILKQGGSAIDATIAAQMVLGLVEPQSSGIGGGAFLLHWGQSDKKITYVDGRETAPAGVDENYFINASNQKPMSFFDAVVGGYSVGVPGVLKMLELAHQQQGRLAWKDLFKPAIHLAETGFLISPRLHKLLSATPQVINSSNEHYFFDGKGEARAVGYRLKNIEYAKTLTLIAEQGTAVFYEGEIAQAMVDAIQKNAIKTGVLSRKDLKDYRAKIRPALCGAYRQYKVCGAGPPSSGATTVLSILGILENFDIASLSLNAADFIHLFAQASNLAFADRNTYLADSDFVSVPVDQLIAPSYLKKRAQLIKKNKKMESIDAGFFPSSTQYQTAISPELPSTTHLSIVDTEGNAVSMTSSIETAFGSRLMVRGFLLNNQLTDFSFTPHFTSLNSF